MDVLGARPVLDQPRQRNRRDAVTHRADIRTAPTSPT
jgi:hypothetical protein